MDDIRVNALVIRAIDYSENDKLLTLITLERGKITAKIKGCKSIKSKLKFAASPLFFGEYLLISKDNRYLVTGCNAKESFHGLTEDINKYYTASLLAEMVNRLTEENSECSGMFFTFVKFLNSLCYMEINPLVLAVKAMLELMKITGYGLNLKNCIVCSDSISRYISLRGGSVCEKHHKPDDIKVSADLIGFLDKINENKIEDLRSFEVDNLLIKEALNTLNIFYTYQTESVLKSLPLLLMLI